MLENTKGAIKNGQSRETGNIVLTLLYDILLLQTSRDIIGLKRSRGNRVYSIHGQYIFNTRLVVELSPLFLSKQR